MPKSLLLISIILLAALLSGCAGNAPQTNAVPTGTPTDTPATATAKALAERGARLVLISHDLQKLEPLVSSLGLGPERVLALEANLLDPLPTKSAAATVAQTFGQVDILLHLVGGWVGGKTLVETPTEDFKEMLDQHVWTTVHVLQAFMPLMIGHPWGRVMIVSSPVASLPSAGRAAYAAAKAAQEALLRDLCQTMTLGSLCAMGGMTPFPVLSSGAGPGDSGGWRHHPEKQAGRRTLQS